MNALRTMEELYEAADDESTEDERRAASEEAIPAPKNPDSEQLAWRIAGSVAAVAGELERDQARIEATLLGLAVADALGAPFEALWADEAAAAVERGLEMTGGGKWEPGWEPGKWTDDTAMAGLTIGHAGQASPHHRGRLHARATAPPSAAKSAALPAKLARC